jgi:hypothetical protein
VTIVRQDKWMVQAEAWCEDCDWRAEAERWKRRVEQGRIHAIATGHEVRGEQGFVFVYNERVNRVY